MQFDCRGSQGGIGVQECVGERYVDVAAGSFDGERKSMSSTSSSASRAKPLSGVTGGSLPVEDGLPRGRWTRGLQGVPGRRCLDGVAGKRSSSSTSPASPPGGVHGDADSAPWARGAARLRFVGEESGLWDTLVENRRGTARGIDDRGGVSAAEATTGRGPGEDDCSLLTGGMRTHWNVPLEGVSLRPPATVDDGARPSARDGGALVEGEGMSSKGGVGGRVERAGGLSDHLRGEAGKIGLDRREQGGSSEGSFICDELQPSTRRGASLGRSLTRSRSSSESSSTRMGAEPDSRLRETSSTSASTSEPASSLSASETSSQI